MLFWQKYHDTNTDSFADISQHCNPQLVGKHPRLQTSHEFTEMTCLLSTNAKVCSDRHYSSHAAGISRGKEHFATQLLNSFAKFVST